MNTNNFFSASKAVEPAINILVAAGDVQKQREKTYNASYLKKRDATKYIDSIRKEIHMRMRSLRHQIYEIGELLHEVKSLLPHGDFTSWLANNFSYSKSTALNCMRVYKACLGIPKMVEFFNPSAMYVICAPRFSKELREALFNNASGVYDIGQKELLEVLMKWKKGLIGIDSPEVQNLLKQQKDKSVYERYKIEIDTFKKSLKESKKKFESLNDLYISSPLMNEIDDVKDARYFEIVTMIEGFEGEVEGLKEILKPKT